MSRQNFRQGLSPRDHRVRQPWPRSFRGKERRAKLTETFNASAYLGAGNLASRSKSSLMPKATRVICPGKWSRVDFYRAARSRVKLSYTKVTKRINRVDGFFFFLNRLSPPKEEAFVCFNNKTFNRLNDNFEGLFEQWSMFDLFNNITGNVIKFVCI